MQIYCTVCKKITEQNYVGLEFYSRKVAGRCQVCRHTNFDESIFKKTVPPQLIKQVDEEKKKTFRPSLNDDLEVLEAQG